MRYTTCCAVLMFEALAFKRYRPKFLITIGSVIFGDSMTFFHVSIQVMTRVYNDSFITIVISAFRVAV